MNLDAKSTNQTSVSWMSYMLSVHLMHAIYVNMSLIVKAEYAKQNENHQLSLPIVYFILTNGTTIHFKHQHRNLDFLWLFPLPPRWHYNPTLCSIILPNISRVYSIFSFLAITSWDQNTYIFHLDLSYSSFAFLFACTFFLFLKPLFIYLFLEQGEGREKDRERSISVWEKHWPVASHTPPMGTWPATWACVLTRNRTSELCLCGTTPSPLSHSSRGCLLVVSYSIFPLTIWPFYTI